MKRFVVLLLCAALLCGPALAAEPGIFAPELDYPGYSDVAADAWYAEVVENITRLGIMDGMGDGVFAPEGVLRLSEAVKMAAVIHNIYAGGTGEFEAGEPWYAVYCDYALENGIAGAELLAQPDRGATRGEAAAIFASALPESELAAVNTVETLPDVTAETPYSAEIFSLYRAGVLRGGDPYGTFGADSSLTRAQAAAIVSRLVTPALRESFALLPMPIMPGLEEILQPMLAGYAGTWSVYVNDVASGEVLCINDVQLLAASTIKLFIAGAVLRAVENGELAYDSAIEYGLYSMLSYSDEAARETLVRKLGGGVYSSGMAVVTALAESYGWPRTGYLLTPELGFTTSVTTAKDCGELLRLVQDGTYISEWASGEILRFLLQQINTVKIPDSLPAGTVVANKTGELSVASNGYNVEHDAAIVYAPSGTYIVVVMSTNCTPWVARAGIRSVSAAVYEYLENN